MNLFAFCLLEIIQEKFSSSEHHVYHVVKSHSILETHADTVKGDLSSPVGVNKLLKENLWLFLDFMQIPYFEFLINFTSWMISYLMPSSELLKNHQTPSPPRLLSNLLATTRRMINFLVDVR